MKGSQAGRREINISTNRWQIKVRGRKWRVRERPHQCWTPSNYKWGDRSRSRMSFCNKCLTSRVMRPLGQISSKEKTSQVPIKTNIWEQLMIEKLARRRTLICQWRHILNLKFTRFPCLRPWTTWRTDAIVILVRDRCRTLTWNQCPRRIRMRWKQMTWMGLLRKRMGATRSRAIFLW